MEFLLRLMDFGKMHNMTFQILSDNKHNAIDITAFYLDVEQKEIRNANMSLNVDVLRDTDLLDKVVVAVITKLCEDLGLDPNEDESKKLEEHNETTDEAPLD